MSGPCHAVRLAQIRDRKQDGQRPARMIRSHATFASHSWTWHCDNRTLLDTTSGNNNITELPASAGHAMRDWRARAKVIPECCMWNTQLLIELRGPVEISRR